MNNLQITWAILQPLKGKALKKDANVFKTKLAKLSENALAGHFPNKEKAVDFVKSLKLGKKYKVTMITDLQFGKMDVNNIEAIFTEKQKTEQFSNIS